MTATGSQVCRGFERVNQADAGTAGKLRSFFDDLRNKGKGDSAKAKQLLSEL